jgi:hypothetical protein
VVKKNESKAPIVESCEGVPYRTASVPVKGPREMEREREIEACLDEMLATLSAERRTR